MSVHSIHRQAFKATLRLRGEDGIYITSDGTEYSLRAVRGETPFRLNSDGQRGGTIDRSTDWLFDLVDFRSLLSRWPIDGDRFRVAIDASGTITTEYRVSSLNDEPVYRTDPTQSHIRIHTKEWSQS